MALKNKCIFVVFFLFSLSLFSQSTLVIKGKVVHHTESLSGVHIQNVSRNTFTTTDANGLFFIRAEEGNTLKITHVGKKEIRRIISRADLEKELLIIELKEQPIELEEVELTKVPEFTPKDFLGYTPEQRTYREKQKDLNTKILNSVGTDTSFFGLSINTLAIINAIRGKTKMYKEQVVNERSLAVARYIIETLGESLKKDFDLTDEDVAMLAYYVMEKPAYQEIQKMKSGKQLLFMLIDEWVNLQEKLENIPKE